MMADQTTLVEQLYVAYFSRPADTAGLAYWNGVLNTNPDGLQAISQAFSASAEYKAMYSQSTNAEIVNQVYLNLFGRPAEQAGIDFWADKLNTHVITVDNVVTQIAAGALDTDKFAYDAKVAVSTTFTAHLDQPFEVAAYSGAHSNQLAANFIATVKDLASAANASDPSAIDGVINQIVTDAGTAPTPAAPIELVGTAPMHDGMF
jgi:hypothetical protein